MKICLVALFVLSSNIVRADNKANILSYATVATNLTLDTIHSLKAEDRSDAIKKQAIRTSITIGISELLKRVIHETRPDGSNDQSFPSEHSALSCVSINIRSGKQFAIEFPVALGTMIGRVVAKKHYLRDVISGCSIGLLTGLIR